MQWMRSHAKNLTKFRTPFTISSFLHHLHSIPYKTPNNCCSFYCVDWQHIWILDSDYDVAITGRRISAGGSSSQRRRYLY